MMWSAERAFILRKGLWVALTLTCLACGGEEGAEVSTTPEPVSDVGGDGVQDGALADSGGSGGPDAQDSLTTPDTELPPVLCETPASPGRVPLRRLSHYEYERTLRDLLILPEISPAVGFPADTPAHGFDNVAGVLTMSALLFEKYERMSEELVDQALSVSKVELFEAQFEAESLEGSIGKATSTGWNLWSNGSVPALVTVPDDGLYRIRVSAYGQQAGPALPQMAIRVDEKDLLVTFVAAVGGASAVYEVMADLAAGEHSVSAAFLNDFYEADLGNDRNLIIDWLGVEGPYLPETQLKTEEADSGTVDAGTAPAQGLWTVPPGSAFQMEVAVAAGGTYEIQLRAEVNSSVQGEVPVTILEDGETLVTVTLPTNAGGLGTYEVTVQLEAGNPTIAVQIADDDCAAGDCELTLDWVRWVGPVPVPVMSESAAKLLTCVPQSGEDCVAEIIGSFARRAWRRPVTDEEMGFLTALVQLALSEGDSAEVGLSLAFRAILLSPHFLYRVETEPEEPSDDPRLLTDFELATRLAYFLWSTLPDEELLTWAEQGALQVDAILETQVHRMLADPRSNALIESFAGQWLHLRALDDVIRDSVQFPAFDEELAASMRRETELVFEELLHGDGSLLDLIDGHFTYVNARLGAFYGLPTFGEEDFRRVPTDGVQRGGLLTHGSILTVTSHTNRTSPVNRGVFVLEQLLCMPPPPPPPDVTALAAPEDASVMTVREQLELHRADPACAGCHSLMDPIGFALEGYDAIGAWRETDQGFPIDRTGTLFDGTDFDGAMELIQVLKSNPRLPRCFAQKLLTYAIGRTEESGDECAMETLVDAWAEDGYRIRGLIVRLVLSDAFRQRAPEQEVAP